MTMTAPIYRNTQSLCLVHICEFLPHFTHKFNISTSSKFLNSLIFFTFKMFEFINFNHKAQNLDPLIEHK